MSKVRAKFRCNTVVDNGVQKTAYMEPVYGEEGENKDYSEATPAGKLELTIDKSTKAVNFFVPMKEYYLEFTKAD